MLYRFVLQDPWPGITAWLDVGAGRDLQAVRAGETVDRRLLPQPIASDRGQVSTKRGYSPLHGRDAYRVQEAGRGDDRGVGSHVALPRYIRETAGRVLHLAAATGRMRRHRGAKSGHRPRHGVRDGEDVRPSRGKERFHAGIVLQYRR